MCSHYNRHVTVPELFENEYADVSRVESLSAKLYIIVFTLCITLRFFQYKTHIQGYTGYKNVPHRKTIWKIY